MLGIFIIGLLFTVFQATTSEIPMHCRQPPPKVNPDCCKLPQMFTVEDFQECGLQNSVPEKVIGPQCSKHICLLKKYNLMKDDENVDTDALGEFMDKVALNNPDFKDALGTAKEKCLRDDLAGPSEMCTPSKIGFCIMITVLQECPIKDNPNCKDFKDHMDECKSYYPN